LEVMTTSTAASRGFSTTQINSGVQAAHIGFKKARGTPAALSTVANGDYTGSFDFLNHDGSTYLTTAAFGARVNGTVTGGSVPTELFFATSGGPDDTDAYTNGHVRMLISSGGNVGIGTTTPNAKLEVDGSSGSTLRVVDGNQATGRVLTSDSAGQASWQTPATIFIVASSGSLGNGTYYNFPSSINTVSATESARQLVVPRAGVVKNFYLNTSSVQGNNTFVITVRKNGAPTAVTVTIPTSGAVGTYSDTTHSVSFAAGDLLSIEYTNNATGGGSSAAINSISFEY
jgi:hypothetical protein